MITFNCQTYIQANILPMTKYHHLSQPFLPLPHLLSFSSMYSQNSHFDVKESIKYMDQFKTTKILSSHSTSDELSVIARKSKYSLVFETFDKQPLFKN